MGLRRDQARLNCLSAFHIVGKDGLFNEMIEIKKELLKRGANVHIGLLINACALIMKDAGVTIDPNGIIYRCNSLVGYPEFAVGDVRDEGFNRLSDEFLNIEVWKRCSGDCPYVPMCQGGCRFFSYVENNNFKDIFCRREYYDHIIPELVKLEYEKLKKDSLITQTI